MMPLIDADDVPEDNNVFDERHISWNSHRTLREFFGHSQEPEFFGTWLQLFYSITQEEREVLRRADLSTINKSDFPTLNKE